MGTKYINKIIEALEKFEFHEKCAEEILEIIKDGAKAKKFYSLLLKNIEIMENLGLEVLLSENFEKLHGKNTDGLYSMKLKGELNVRILYCNKDGTLALLLCCFEEKSDSKKYSYEKYIPVACKRMVELTGKGEN